MRRVRCARLGVHHLLRVAVVRGDEQRVACLLARSIDRADCRVCMRDRLDCRVKDARVADLVSFERDEKGGRRGAHHVGRGKVAHDKLVLGGADDVGDFVRYAAHAHLGQQVVRRYFGRVDQVPLLVLELLLDAAVEEERHVGVFLRFCERVSSGKDGGEARID